MEHLDFDLVVLLGTIYNAGGMSETDISSSDMRESGAFTWANLSKRLEAVVFFSYGRCRVMLEFFFFWSFRSF